MNLFEKSFYGTCLFLGIIGVVLISDSITKADETLVVTVTENTESVTEVVETNNVPVYETQREKHLFTEVEKTVDLPGFGDYQDLLASYAYNTCKRKLGNITGTYSCENLVLTWNSENGGRNHNTFNHANTNGTSDGGLCQLNSAYHKPFIDSRYFKNPLSQLDYCLNVWQDAKRKGTMPRYGFYPRHTRNKGIAFGVTESVTVTAGVVEYKEPVYPKARQAQDKADALWNLCKTEGECLH